MFPKSQMFECNITCYSYFLFNRGEVSFYWPHVALILRNLFGVMFVFVRASSAIQQIETTMFVFLFGENPACRCEERRGNQSCEKLTMLSPTQTLVNILKEYV